MRRSDVIGWISLALALLPGAPSLAATCTSISSGNWNSASTWSCVGTPAATTPGAADDVIIDSTNGITVTVNVAAQCRNLTVDEPTASNSVNLLTVGANSLTVNGDATIVGGSLANRDAELRLGTGSVTITGNLIVNNNNSNVVFTGAGTLNIGGNFSNNSATFTPSTGTVVYNGTGAQSVGAYTYNNLSVNKSSGTATLTGNTTVNGNLTVGTSGGTLDLSTFTANRASAGGTLTVVNGAALQIGGTGGFPANYSTRTLGATSTVEYNGTDQTVSNENYGHLTLSGSGTKTPVAGTTTIQGNFTLGAGVTYAGTINNPVVNLAGNFSNSGTFNSGTGTFTFNGSVAQSLTGATTFSNMTLDNTAGLTINSNMTVTETLTFSRGKITTGTNKVIIGTAGSISGVSSARYVVGIVEKQFPGTGTFLFPVGDPSNYTPAEVTFTSMTSTGSLAVQQTPTDHANIGTSTLDPNQSVNRYWTFTSTGLAGTYDATFNYVTGDKDAGSNPPDYVVERFSGGSWFVESVSPPPDSTGTSITALGVTGFGDFAIAEPGASANHFVISHAGTGVNCQPEIVTVTVHRSNHNVITNFTGTVTLQSFQDGTATLRGDWTLNSGNGTFTATGTGTATYTFVSADNGQASFNLRYTSPETVDINVVQGTVSELSGTANNGSEPVFTDPRLTFVNSGFRISDGASAAASIRRQIAGKESDLNPGAQTLAVQAIRTDTNTFACVGVFADNTVVDVEMASECINPTGCQAGSNVLITNDAVTTGVASNSSGSVTSYTSVPLRFSGAMSEAPFTFNYPDAGIIKLHLRRDIPLGDGPGSGNLMVGGSNSFLVRPFAFSIESVDGQFIASPADATDATPFKKAGEMFSTTVEAVVWQAADDANNDGVADTGADLTNNAATPNFGNETTPPTVDITHQLALPSTPGDPGTLSGGSGIGGFSSGAATATLSFDEVGIIHLTAAHNDYLSDVDADITGTRRNIGRFYPDRFTVTANAPAFADACTAGANPFTYLDQPFYYDIAPVLTVTALNTAGVVTENYGGGTTGAEGFWKLDSALERNYADQAGMTAVFADIQDADTTLAGHLDFDGQGTIALDSGTAGDVFMYQRQDEEGEFAADVNLSFTAATLTDTDGACYDPDDDGTCNALSLAGLGGATLRFGRLIFTNAYGSELLPLDLPLRAEYFNGTAFVLNTDDACTTIGATDLVLSSTVEAGQTDGDVDISNAAVCTGAGLTVAAAANQPFSGGGAGLSFSSPGEGCAGLVDATLDLSNGTGLGFEWLRYDWDGDGIPAEDPSGRAAFGVFHGADELIYVREPWN